MKRIKGNSKIGNESGRLGEEIACRFLESKGYKLIDRNYRKKWGEIDIIGQKEGILHFFEVKTVSCEIGNFNVAHETSDKYRPEDNIHPWKLKRLARVIQSYLLEKNISPETLWYFDAVTVKMDRTLKKAMVSALNNLTI